MSLLQKVRLGVTLALAVLGTVAVQTVLDPRIDNDIRPTLQAQNTINAILGYATPVPTHTATVTPSATNTITVSPTLTTVPLITQTPIPLPTPTQDILMTTCYRAQTTVSLRSGPGTSFERVDLINLGQVVEVENLRPGTGIVWNKVVYTVVRDNGVLANNYLWRRLINTGTWFADNGNWFRQVAC